MMEEKKDFEKPEGIEGGIGDPVNCSYEGGQFIYKDPATNNQFVWKEEAKRWVPKSVLGGTTEVQLDPETDSYFYTDQDGTPFEWDAAKGAWFPKGKEQVEADKGTITSSSFINENNLSPTAASDPSTPPPSSGFHNPNYDNSLQQQSNHNSDSRNSRRFFYAALSPTDMGVNEPVLFLSPDDQVNNNSTIPHEPTNDLNGPGESGVNAVSGASNPLPSGWEKHEDANGPYYWHIKSGTIQRDPPSQNCVATTSNPALMIPGSLQSSVTPFRRSQTISSQLSSVIPQSNSNSSGTGNNTTTTTTSTAEKRKSWSQYLENSSSDNSSNSFLNNHSSFVPHGGEGDKPLRFVAVSLGCLNISEEDLTPERSSRAVSKVIAELTNPSSRVIGGPGLEVAGKIWGGGNELYLELDDSHLRVKVKEKGITVLEQAIHSIRVWGVGREDPRDFAFVAREKQTRQFLCHVFRLEMYARPLANSLRDACKKIMIERQAKQKRPTTLPTGLRKSTSTHSNAPACFPTPMDEPRKNIKAYYIGSKAVNRPTGMETLNAAIDALGGKEPIPVQVSVAPSVIKVTSEESDTPAVDFEVRVRFLSFLGIGSDVKTCGIIVHTARDDFEAHCFYSNPSTGALCKAIEAACVLRYQKCLDAHHAPAGGTSGPSSSGSTASVTSPKTTAANLASALKTVFSSIGRLDEEFLARYNINYGSEYKYEPPPVAPQPDPTEVQPTSSGDPEEQDNKSSLGKRKLPQQPPQWFEIDETQNTKVYVSNLPTDITEEEFVEFMGKCGLVVKDPATNKYKIKLYEQNGQLKGDGLCTYIKVESVDLALQILDGSYLKNNQVKVERAKFTLKGQYDPSKKPKQRKKKEKEKLKKKQEALFAWKPEKLRGERPKCEKVVVVKNAFSPDDFNDNVELILELKEDFRDEASKLGTCRKVEIYDAHPEGVVQIFMSNHEEADAVVLNFNGRFFGGRRLTAENYDGVTRFKINETDAEREKRLAQWEKFIEEDEEAKANNDDNSEEMSSMIDPGAATPPRDS